MSDTPIYIEVAVKVQPLEPFRDIFIAQLGTLGFESFSETAEGFEAYIIKEDFDEAAVKEHFFGRVCKRVLLPRKSNRSIGTRNGKTTSIPLRLTDAYTFEHRSTKRNKALSIPCS